MFERFVGCRLSYVELYDGCRVSHVVVPRDSVLRIAGRLTYLRRQIQTGDEDEDELDTFKGPVF